MKRNITINLCGQLFNIDEDAYELLLAHEEELSRQHMTAVEEESTETYLKDFEQSTADYFNQLKNEGIEAITIEHVRVLTGDSQPRKTSTHKLLRDSDNKVLGGVIAGLANYLKLGNPLMLRLIGLLMIFAVKYSVILYFVMWLLIPAAPRANTRHPLSNTTKSPENDNSTSVISFVFRLLLLLGGIFTLMIFVSVIFAVLYPVGISGTNFGVFVSGFEGADLEFIANEWPQIRTWILAACMLGLVWSGIGVYGLLRTLLGSRPMSSKMRATLVIVSLLSLILMYMDCQFIYQKAEPMLHQINERNRKELLQTTLNNRIFNNSYAEPGTYMITAENDEEYNDTLTYRIYMDCDSVVRTLHLHEPFKHEGGLLHYDANNRKNPIEVRLERIE